MDLGSIFGTAATNYIGAGIGGVFDLLFGSQMANENFRLNELAADNADKRRRAMFADLESPSAKIRMLKEAGLSPALYAGGDMGGTIGATTGAQGGASGSSLGSISASGIDIASMNLQNAQARLANAEADKLEGKNFAAGLDKIKVFADAGLKEASTRYQNSLTAYQDIINKYQDENAQISLVKLRYDSEKSKHDAAYSYWSAVDKGLDFKFNTETFETRKQEILNTVVNIATQTALEQSQIALNNEQKEHIIDFASAALENAKAHTYSAKAYGLYVDSLATKFEKDIELRAAELNLDKWKTALKTITDLLQTFASLVGNASF